MPDHSAPDSLVVPFQPAIFNTPAYAGLHAHRFAGPPLRCIRRVPGTHAIRGVFQSIGVAPGHHASPVRAPHGGFDMAADATPDDLEALIGTTEAALQQVAAHTLDIIQPPVCHAPAQGAAALAALCRHGYIVTRQELNQSIPVDGRPLLAMGSYATRKRAAKALRLGVSTMLLPPGQHRAAYDLLSENRASKGRSMSMAWDDVAAMTAAFPDQMRVFGAMQCDRLIAAAITVAVSPAVLYVHAWGERPGMEPVSPVTLLAVHVHDFAGETGFRLLDLGTSSEQGVVNRGLHGFKASLGAEDSLKLWLRKDLR